MLGWYQAMERRKVLVPEGLRLKWRGQRRVLQNLGDDLRLPKHVRTLACSLEAPCGGGETVGRNGPQCTPDTRVTNPTVLPTRKGGLKAVELLHRTPRAGTSEHLSWGTALNVLFRENPQAVAQAWIETEFLLKKVEGLKVDST